MLMALRFKPSRFFLKGKVRQKKQATYINILPSSNTHNFAIFSAQISASVNVCTYTKLMLFGKCARIGVNIPTVSQLSAVYRQM